MGITCSHTSGEIHAGNPHRNEEESWFLVEIDAPRHIYALQNWRNGNYLGKSDRGCVRADGPALGPTEMWELISGKHFGIINAVVFQNVHDQSVIGAQGAGANTPCGGEVWAPSANTPVANSSWPGWWVLEAADAPEAGRDAWNTVGGAFNGIFNNIKPADIVALIALL